jgi:hypothetical protein
METRRQEPLSARRGDCRRTGAVAGRAWASAAKRNWGIELGDNFPMSAINANGPRIGSVSAFNRRTGSGVLTNKYDPREIVSFTKGTFPVDEVPTGPVVYWVDEHNPGVATAVSSLSIDRPFER